MDHAAPAPYVSRLTEVAARAIRALLPLETAAGCFLADPHRTDPFPATPQDITLNRALYALARLPDIDDPLNPYFDDDDLRQRAIRIGAYLCEAIGATGGILLDAEYGGLHLSGVHSLNFWTCPQTVRFWLASLTLLDKRLSETQRKNWRDGLNHCLQLLASRHDRVGEWPGLQAPDAPRLSAAAATGAALLAGGQVLDNERFCQAGQRIWDALCQRIGPAGAETPLLDGMDIDAMLSTLNGLPTLSEMQQRCELRLAGWRARLTMPNGGINELFDRHRPYSRFGMCGAAPALLRHGHSVPAAIVLESYEARPRRGLQAISELAAMVAAIDSLQHTLPQHLTPPLPARLSAQLMQEQYFGWFGGEASRAWLFRGNSWTAGCRAPIATPVGFSNPWSVRHQRTPLWIDGSTPTLRRTAPLPFQLPIQPLPDTPKRNLAVQGDSFFARFGVCILDEETIQLTARVRWNRPEPERDTVGLQMLLEKKEGDHLRLRTSTGSEMPMKLGLESIQTELPGGAQIEFPCGAGPACLLAVHTTGPAALLRWNLPPRRGSQRLPLPTNRLELFLPFALQQDTRIDLVLSVPHELVTPPAR